MGFIKYVFNTTHTYGSQSQFSISISECCWSNDLVDGGHQFIIAREISLETAMGDPLNEGPIPTTSMSVIVGTRNQPVFFDPVFVDMEGDDIGLRFSTPLGPVVNFSFPNQFKPGPDNLLVTTDNNAVAWQVPQCEGEYYVGYELEDIRNGEVVSTTFGGTVFIIKDIISTSVNTEAETKYKVFPNPVQQELVVDGEAWDKIEIFNSLGNKVKVAFENEIDLSDFPAGPYVILIWKADKSYSKKIFKK